METKTYTVYTFAELSEPAKEKAREWYRGLLTSEDFAESSIEDAKEIGFKITEWNINPIDASGKFTEDACDCADKIIKNHGEICETFKLATAFLKECDNAVKTAPKDCDGEFEDEHSLDEDLDALEEEFRRDVIARIDWLQDQLQEAIDDEAKKREFEEEYGAELAALTALAEEAEGYAADWQHGETLIRDSHFEDYARELADDIGAIPKDAQWPCTCIDWEKAARELQMDYTGVEFDGVSYWIR